MTDFNKVYQVTKDLNILYAEDNATFQEETNEVLSILFKKVTLANDGQEAIDMYKQYFTDTSSYYDIVITDMNMPYIDGIKLTKLIYELNSKQPIIVISGYTDTNNLVNFINIGVSQFLFKPIDSDKILSILFKIANEILELKSKQSIDSKILHLNDNYYWDSSEHTLYSNNVPVKLTRREILLLQLFIKNKNRISTYEEIFILLWKDEQYKATVQHLKTIISNFRKKIPYQKIESISKVGYKLKF